jgi:hypothetical protein
MNVKAHLVNRTHVKEAALELPVSRAHKVNRVPGEFFLKCEPNMKGSFATASAAFRSKVE